MGQPSDQQTEDDASGTPERGRVGFLGIIGSILSAAFGVQSSAGRERDFAHGNYRHFIIGGILFTVLFVLTVVMVVRWVLAGT